MEFSQNLQHRNIEPPRYVRKRLFKRHIWSCRSKYTPAVSGDCVIPRTVRQKEAVEENMVGHWCHKSLFYA